MSRYGRLSKEEVNAIWLNMSGLACWFVDLQPVITATPKRLLRASAKSNATGQPVSLMDGKLSFSLPADMTDPGGKLGAGEQHARLLRCHRAKAVIVGLSVTIPAKIWVCCPNVWKINSAAATPSFRW